MSSDPIDDPRIAAHLAAVAQALGDEPSAEAVLEHLRGHIREAVAARAGETDAIAAVLGGLDAPADYAPQLAATTPPRQRHGWWAFLAALIGPVAGTLLGVLCAPWGAGAQIGWLFFCAIELSAATAGFVARRQPWGRTALLTAVALVVTPLFLAIAFPS